MRIDYVISKNFLEIQKYNLWFASINLWFTSITYDSQVGYRDLCWSLTITISRDQLLHFQWKKTSRPIPRLFQRSKVVSIKLPILPFLKFKIWQVLMPTSASGCWWCDLCLSEREKLPRGGGGVGGVGGGGEELPVLIENFMEHASWTVSHAQKEIQRPHMEIFLPKLKILDKDIDLAIYRYLCRSLSITISRDHFNVKKTPRPIPRLFQRSKVVSSNRTTLPFF